MHIEPNVQKTVNTLYITPYPFHHDQGSRHLPTIVVDTVLFLFFTSHWKKQIGVWYGTIEGSYHALPCFALSTVYHLVCFKVVFLSIVEIELVENLLAGHYGLSRTQLAVEKNGGVFAKRVIQN